MVIAYTQHRRLTQHSTRLLSEIVHTRVCGLLSYLSGQGVVGGCGQWVCLLVPRTKINDTVIDNLTERNEEGVFTILWYTIMAEKNLIILPLAHEH